ncbi:MAG: hypothetical protein PF513_04860 [Tenericutes bacterium]|jgi:hypothetical protein|nr:hypothetical protein [Mycoplasmatota bacterium]
MGFKLTKEQEDRIKKMQERSQNRIRSEIRTFFRNIDELNKSNEKKEYTFWDKIWSPTATLGKGLLDGALEGAVGAVQSINVIGAHLVNDIGHIFDSKDDTNAFKDSKYAIANLGINALEGVVNFAVSTTANLGRAFEASNEMYAKLYDEFGWEGMAEKTRTIGSWFDPEWAFGEGKVLEQNADIANVSRSMILNQEKGQSFNENFEKSVGDSTEDPKEQIQDRYYKTTQDYLKGSVGVQNWVEENVTKEFSGWIAGGQEEIAQDLYSDSRLFETAVGVSESMGNIVAMWGVSALAKNVMPNATPAQVNMISNAYFASSVFGKMYQEAINNGANYNDAFIYATGQSMMETLVEQTGGFKGSDGSGALSIWNKIKSKGISGITKDAFEEGMEEVYSEFGGKGYEQYNKGIEQEDNKEFYSNVMFSFISGAGASMGMGSARNAVFNLTADSKANDFHESLKEEGFESANKNLNRIAKGLNNSGIGLTVNESGTSKMSKMNEQQKDEFLKRNKLENYIIKDENDNYIAQEITEDTFLNRIGEDVVDNDMYAMNENVRGVDISDGGTKNVITGEQMNGVGEKALEIANDMDVPIALYQEKSDNTGEYGRNGVLYINQNNIDQYNVEETIVKHELIHAIKKTDSKLYKEIERTVEDFVQISVDETNNLQFEYTNDTVKEIFQSQHIESRIANSAQQSLNDTNNADIAIQDAQEEVTAYFAQNIVTDNKLRELLTKKEDTRNLLQKIADSFNKDDYIDKRFKNKRIARKIKKLKKLFEAGAKKVVEDKKSIGYVLKQNQREGLLSEFKKAYEKQVSGVVDAIIEFSLAVDTYGFIDTVDDVDAYKKELMSRTDESMKRLMDEIIALEAMYKSLEEEDNITEEIQEAYDVFQKRMEALNGEDKTMKQKAYDPKIKQTTKEIEVGGEKIQNTIFKIGKSFLSVYENSPFAQGRNAIYDFNVEENKRRQGIGTQLLKEAQLKYNNVSAQVSNVNSIKTHYKAGFRLTENPNFSLEQIIEEYKKSSGSVNMEYKKTINKTTRKNQKKYDPSLTDKDRSEIKKVFTDANIAEMFELNKEKKYRLKSEKMTAESNKQKTIMKDGIKYRSTEYAISAYNAVSSTNISSTAPNGKVSTKVKNATPLKLDDLNETEHMIYEFLASTKLNFVLYKAQGSTLGFSIPWSDANVVFINLRNGAYKQAQIVEILIHEHLHEAFKYSRIESFDYAYELSNILFTPVWDKSGKQVVDVKPNKIWDTINEHYVKDYSGFLNYFKQFYGKKRDHTSVKTNLEIYNLLSNAKSKTLKDTQKASINEITAQVTGVLFSSAKTYKDVLGGQSKANYKMYELFDKLLADKTMSPNVRTYLESGLSEYKKLFDAYMKEVEKKFPKKKKYTLKELNTFISDFTDGKYTTRGNLLLAYFEEKANKTRGDATITIDNIIYVSSIFAEKVQTGISNYSILQDEFQLFKDNIEGLITKPDSLLAIDGLSKDYRRITKKVKKMINTVNGKQYKRPIAVDEAGFQELADEIDVLQEGYIDLTDEVIKIFHLPNRVEFEKVLGELADAVAEVIDQAKVFGLPNDLARLGKTLDDLKQVASDLGNTNEINSGVFGKIKVMQQKFRESNVKNLLYAINRSVSNVTKAGQSKRQKESKQNKEFDAVESVVIDIYQSISRNMDTYGKLKGELAPLFEKLRSLIDGSKVVGSEVELSQNSSDAQVTKQVQDEIQEIKDNLIKVQLRDLYEQFAFIFEDKKFVQDKYPFDIYDSLEIDEIVKEFKETKVASILSNILKEFKTVYESVFEDGMSLNAYAQKNAKEIEAVEEKYNFKFMKSLIVRGMTPQDILDTYIKVTQGDMSFFEDFYREYLSSTRRQEMVMADFSRVSKAWHKEHKTAIEDSTEEIEISNHHLLQMDRTHMNKVIKEADEKIKKLNKEINKKQAGKNEQIKKRKIMNKDLARYALTKDRNKTNKKGKVYRDANAKAKALKTRKDVVIAEEKTLTKEIKALKYDKKSNSRDVIIREELIKVREAKTEKQYIQKGHIVSLYLSVLREIEMYKMVKNGNYDIKPTDHFAFGNQIQVLNNQLLERKGYKHAMNRLEKFTIFTQEREQLLEYLEEQLTPEDIQSIHFARSIFDQNYAHVNELYKKKYKVDLTRQTTYIPFSTATANIEREMKLKRVNRNNIGVEKGFIMKTTLGANEDLRIENIFSVLDSQTRASANYSFDRLNTDYQNLLVNKIGGSTFQEALQSSKTGVFGLDNNIEDNINQMLTNISQYSDLREGWFVKGSRKVLRNTVKATIGLAVPMYMKQYLSALTIYSKQRAKIGDPNRLSLIEILEGVAESAFLKHTGSYKWLIENNDNFYFRAEMKFLPNLSQNAPVSIFGAKNKNIRTVFNTGEKVLDGMTAHVGRADARVLVGAFTAKVNRLLRKNKNLTKEEARIKANEWLSNEVLLYSVANTSASLRSTLSNSRNVFEMMAGIFQSENIIHFSSIMRDIFIAKNNGWKKQLPLLTRDLMAWLLAGLFSAFIDQWWQKTLGYGEEIPEGKENINLILNEFILQNLIGSIPYVNQFTKQMQFDFDMNEGHPTGIGLTGGFEPKLPLLSDFGAFTNDAFKIMDKDGNIDGRAIYETIEELAYMFGIPIKNAEKMGKITSNVFASYGSEQGRTMDRVINNQTKSEAYYQAIKNENQEEVDGYVKDMFNNTRVVSEIVDLNMKVDDKNRIKIYDVNTFRKLQSDDTYKNIKIPEAQKQKFQRLTERGLRKLITRVGYRKLTDKHKAKTMQRVINYYYNYMKAFIVDGYREAPDLNDSSSVVDRAIQYGLSAMEEELEK